MKKRFVASVFVAGLALFLCDGMFQMIPNLGVTSVQPFNDAPTLPTEVPGMYYYKNNSQVALVAQRPAKYYHPARFLAVEFITALFTSFALACVLWLVRPKSLKQFAAVVLLSAGAAISAVHLPYANWWGFGLNYTVGVSIKLLAGWLLVAIIHQGIMRLHTTKKTMFNEEGNLHSS